MGGKELGKNMGTEYKVGKCKPPLEYRFPVNRPPKPHTQKHPEGYLTSILKKLLNKKMKITDPEVKKVLEIKSGTKAALKKIIMLRYILNAIQGENQAIEGILDRIDGKLKSNGNHPLVDQSKHYHFNLTDEQLINEARKAGIDIPPAIESRFRSDAKR